MHESQTKPRGRNRTEALHEPWHDAEGSDQACQRERIESRSPGRARAGEFGRADDDQSVDKHQQQHNASHSPPENSPSDPERFPICRYHVKHPFNFRLNQDPARATDTPDWAWEEEAEEAESARTVWESGRSVLDLGPSAGSLHADGRELQPASTRILNRQRATG